MITQTNNSLLRGAYSNNIGKTKDSKEESSLSNITKQGDTSKIDQLKEAVNSGQYKVDLKALSEKIAQELL
jgi:anti-sigma28 factor (negative regulator of flagellin synthesis)